MKKVYIGIFTAALCLFGASSFAQTFNYSFTGSEQFLVVPPCIDSIIIDMAGGQGGGANEFGSVGSNGGLGGRVQAVLSVNAGDSVFIYVGESGFPATQSAGGAGGFNGGGNGQNAFGDYSGGGGGGASDIRINGHTVSFRSIVAGGGAGGGFDCSFGSEFGGAGGGLSGNTGGHCVNVGYGGGGGTQVAGGPGEPGFNGWGQGGDGTLGVGGDGGNPSAGGGGGGGYYGGGGGCWGGGGGGSGFTSANANQVTQTTGYEPGNGYVTITLHSGLNIAITQTNVTCAGGNNGSASASPSCGVAPYTYSWAPGGSTNSSISNLTAGTYTITVTDNNGKVGVRTVTITQPTPMSVVDSITNVTCHGAANGKAFAVVSGGQPPFSYLWAPGGATTSSITGLSQGTYSVGVRDACGSTFTTSATITQPTALQDSVSFTPVTCHGDSNGTASVFVMGGTPRYTYNWMPGNANSATDVNLKSGTYTITTTDSHGCKIKDSITVTQPAALALVWNGITNPKCYGDLTGSAAIKAIGAGPFTYSWFPQEGDSLRAVNLHAGTYIVSVTDNCGAVGKDTVIITQPAALNISLGYSIQSGICKNTLWATANGGVPGYTYSWSPGGQTTDTIKNQCSGSYTVFVTDNHGCMDSVVENLKITGISAINNADDIKVYPVPTKGILNIDINDNNLGFTSLLVYDITGREVMQQKTDVNSTHLNLNVSGLDNGMYFLRMIGNDTERNLRFEISK